MEKLYSKEELWRMMLLETEACRIASITAYNVLQGVREKFLKFVTIPGKNFLDATLTKINQLTEFATQEQEDLLSQKEEE